MSLGIQETFYTHASTNIQEDWENKDKILHQKYIPGDLENIVKQISWKI